MSAACFPPDSEDAQRRRRFALTQQFKLLDKLVSRWPRRRQRVLEVACGHGLLLEHFWKLGFDVTGVALTQAYLEEARARLGRRADIQLAAPACLPYDDNEFDYVLALTLLERLQTREAVREALEEAVRVARKGVLVSFPNSFSLHRALSLVNRRWAARSANLEPLCGHLLDDAAVKPADATPGDTAAGRRTLRYAGGETQSRSKSAKNPGSPLSMASDAGGEASDNPAAPAPKWLAPWVVTSILYEVAGSRPTQRGSCLALPPQWWREGLPWRLLNGPLPLCVGGYAAVRVDLIEEPPLTPLALKAKRPSAASGLVRTPTTPLGSIRQSHVHEADKEAPNPRSSQAFDKAQPSG